VQHIEDEDEQQEHFEEEDEDEQQEYFEEEDEESLLYFIVSQESVSETDTR